jgi:hypothetical protein
LTNIIAKINVIFMNFGSIVKTTGIFILAMLMLFPITRIHSDICHVANFSAPEKTQEFDVNCISAGRTDRHPATGHCTTCFFNQLLTQCLFPSIETALISESFSFCEPLSPEAISHPALERKFNRGPPAAIIIL